MRTIKINVHYERERFLHLYDAMIKREKVEGGYIIDYSWWNEQRELYAKFTLREADDKVSNQQPDRGKLGQSAIWQACGRVRPRSRVSWLGQCPKVNASVPQ
jgi:hypothetical protein